MKLLNLRLNPMLITSSSVEGSLYPSELWVPFPYQLWDIFARTFLFASDSNPTQTLPWFTYLGHSVVGLASGTAGSRSSKTVCPLNFAYLYFLTCVGLTISLLSAYGCSFSPKSTFHQTKECLSQYLQLISPRETLSSLLSNR